MLFLILLPACTSHASPPESIKQPSFDCANATTTVERAICASSHLAELDLTLDRTHRNLPDALPLDLQSEADWLFERDACGSAPPVAMTGCIAAAYTSRLRELGAVTEPFCGLYAQGMPNVVSEDFEGLGIVSISPSDEYGSLNLSAASVAANPSRASCSVELWTREELGRRVHAGYGSGRAASLAEGAVSRRTAGARPTALCPAPLRISSREAMPQAHCGNCGRPFEKVGWPRLCLHCTQTSPAKVAILLVPVPGGLLGVRRGTEPGYGGLALPGGFCAVREPWQRAGARVLLSGCSVSIDPGTIISYGLLTAPSRRMLLFFGLTNPVHELEPFVPNEDVLERVAISPNRDLDLVFPEHQRMVRFYFEEHRVDRQS